MTEVLLFLGEIVGIAAVCWMVAEGISVKGNLSGRWALAINAVLCVGFAVTLHGMDVLHVTAVTPNVEHGSMFEWVFIVLAGLVASATSALGINDQLVNKFLLGRGKGKGGK